jgi:hypothetical protein
MRRRGINKGRVRERNDWPGVPCGLEGGWRGLRWTRQECAAWLIYLTSFSPFYIVDPRYQKNIIAIGLRSSLNLSRLIIISSDFPPRRTITNLPSAPPRHLPRFPSPPGNRRRFPHGNQIPVVSSPTACPPSRAKIDASKVIHLSSS